MPVSMTVGLFGARLPAAWHLAAYVDSPRVEAVALAEPDGSLRESLHARFGIIKRAVADYGDVLADASIAVVDIRGPLQQRAEMAVAALQAGKQVICLGPPAASAADFRRMMAAEGSGRLFVLAPDLHVPAIEKACELLAEGELGEPILASWVATDWARTPFDGPGAGDRCWPDSGLGLLLDRCYGAAVLLQRWLGPAEAVCATSAGERVESADIRTRDGALGQMTAIAAVAGDVAVERRLIGSDASLLIRDDPEDELTLGGFVDGVFQPIPVRHTPYVQRHATRVGLQALLECIAGEGEPPLPNEEALRAMELLDAARESLRGGGAVALATG
ncbi:MAG TPA: hypothetical protein DGT21_13590 [Armatimonadetes bacterium]|nr:hypothetical protein [Armatimonadota bacterium]